MDPSESSRSSGLERDQLQRMVDAHGVLHEAARSIEPATDLSTTVAGVLRTMRSLVSFRGGSIALVTDDSLRIVAADPAPSDEVLALRVPVGVGLSGQAAQSGELVYCPDLDTDPRVDPEVRRLGSNVGMTSYLAVPLICLREVVGVIQVDSPDEDAFDEVDRTLLLGLGALVANAIESARQFDVRQQLEGQQRKFIQMVGHELRTPLTIARGFVEGLMTDQEMERSNQQLYLDRTHGALQRLDGLVEELIVMSQVEGADIEARSDLIQIRPLLERSADHAADPDLVRIDCPDDLVLETDDRLVALIVDALVDNALKYAGDAHIIVQGQTISIRDHGEGLPADIVGHEFDRFTRSDSNDTTTAGLGLGLAMASTLATLLGGALTIADALGGGTVISLVLPPTAAGKLGA